MQEKLIHTNYEALIRLNREHIQAGANGCVYGLFEIVTGRYQHRVKDIAGILHLTPHQVAEIYARVAEVGRSHASSAQAQAEFLGTAQPEAQTEELAKITEGLPGKAAYPKQLLTIVANEAFWQVRNHPPQKK